MGNMINLQGQRFGRLVVLERNGSNARGKAVWKCVCDCGNIANVCSEELRNGKTKSCGCFRNEMKKKLNTTHGMSGTRLYSIWTNMIESTKPPAMLGRIV